MKLISNSKFNIHYSTLSLISLILTDQITKAIFASRDFFIGPVHLMLVKNYGLPFGINSSGLLSFFVALFVMTFLATYFWLQKDKLPANEKFGLGLIFAGALSNLIDRVVLGYVRDFIDLRLTFVFNLADVFIFAGILLVLFGSFTASQTIQRN